MQNHKYENAQQCIKMSNNAKWVYMTEMITCMIFIAMQIFWQAMIIEIWLYSVWWWDKKSLFKN